MSAIRLPEGGRIDRTKPLSFTFDGRQMSGLAGDTLASALLANGVRLVGRSFKYHRPRGILSAGPEEPNALVTIGAGGARVPNLPATTVELAEGLGAESQNRRPSLAFDLQSVNGLFSPFLSSGFYYKTFMGPTRRSWLFYERFIRKAAGLGRAGMEPDRDRYEVRNAFTDVAVVGGGPAGMTAARAAALAGARVVLIEQDFLLGGALLGEAAASEAAGWLAAAEAELRTLPEVTPMLRTTAFGLYDGNVLGLVERHEGGGPGTARQGVTLLHANAVVFATGALERPLTFPDNDRPGVMLASAARTYLNRFGVLAGRHVVVAAGDETADAAACGFARHGAQVTVADERPTPDATLAARAAAAGVSVLPGTRVAGIRGARSVHGAIVSRGGHAEAIACDLVLMAGGWSPSVHLTSHLGVRPRYREDIGGFVPGALRSGHFGAGALTGSFAPDTAIAEGHQAGKAGAEFCGKTRPVAVAGPFPAVPGTGAGGPPPSGYPATGRGKSFVDFQMDVTAGDIALAHREGYQPVEHLKRYTTLGMGTDQGKTSNFNALSIMASLSGAAIPEVGTTTFRPPYTPVAIGALAGSSIGRHYKPVRRTPMHDWHVAHGAEMLEVGLWMRPYFYRAAGATVDEAYVAEMRTVREAAGLMDISTLGKIDVQGPDAAILLDRVYANGFARLPVGRARYGVMLRDDGIVFDDGTTTRLGEHRFFMTTSTAKAADVLSRLEFLLDSVWPDLRVAVTSVTDEWAAMSIAGPHSREILSKALEGLDLSDAALPHMGLLEGDFDGRALRILRLSYSGELAYEVYVGASGGEAAWRRLLEAGEAHGLKPYGVEALGALRVEKGHVAGPEIDGRTTLDDLGLARMAAKRSGYVGAVLGRRPALTRPDRQRLVGLMPVDAGERLSGGAVLFGPGEVHRGHGRGRVTSVTYSPTLGTYVGLGLLAGGAGMEGTEVVAVHTMKGEAVRARVVSPVFLDPEGARLRG